MRWMKEHKSGAHGRVVLSFTEHGGGLVTAAWGEPFPPLLPVEIVPGSSSLSNERALPVGKIQDKTVLEQPPPRQRRVITLSSAYSKQKASVVLSP